MLSILQDVTTVGAVPVLGLSKIIDIATDILSTIQTFLYNDRALNDLAFNASGLVCAVTLECQNIINKGRNVPSGFQNTISTLAENLTEIKGFAEKKKQRPLSRRIMFLLTDQVRCVHYRAQLQHCVEIFDTLSKISIRSSANIIIHDVEKAAEEERRREDRQNEKGSTTEPRLLPKSGTFSEGEKPLRSERSILGGEESPDTNSGSPSQSHTGTPRGSRTPLFSQSPRAFPNLVLSQVDLARGSMSDIPSLGIFKGDKSTRNGDSKIQREKRRTTD